MLQPMEEMVLPPKRQAVVDRLRRRIETYRRRQSECVPRFDQSFTGACEQQNLETSALQKRFLEGKAKRQAKKTDRKPDLPSITGNLHSSVHVQQKFGCGDYEPPSKLQCGGGAGGGAGEALTKFSVEIVQQLEFTTSAADSQPQQISTNVTVKALANAVKTSGSPPPPPQPRAPTPLDCERECKAECKSEVADDEFVGLDECAAALERDAAAAFPGLADLIGEDDGDEITSFEDLITEISEYPEFMKDFDLDGGGGVHTEPLEGEGGPRPYGGGELSPAAQTLKHMAEQHQQGAGGDWARYRSYGYRPRGAAPPPHQAAPPPHQPPQHPQHQQHQQHHPLEHLHLTQQQQMQLSQAHHNLQVSAAQHMQVTGGGGHVSVAAQQGMYASFGHQNAPSPQHHQGGGGGGGCDSYSLSQSQSINFQQMRARPAAPAPPAPSPQQPPLGVAAAGISREQQAKMLQQQQQQMLRAQQQQQQMRPPPPEYKARFLGRRPPAPAPRPFAPHAGHAVHGAHPGHPTHATHAAHGGHTAHAPHATHAPHTRPYSPEWRHVLMQQQAARQFPHQHQSAAGGFGMSPMGGGVGVGGGVGGGGGGALPHQQMMQHRLQQQQQMLQHQHAQQQQQQQQRTQSQQQSSMSHLLMQQNQMMNVQGQMPNIHMSQSQSMSMQQNGMGGMNPGHGGGGGGGGVFGGAGGGGGGDFSLDFLDNMSGGDGALTAQELLNSLDNSFLNDIL